MNKRKISKTKWAFNKERNIYVLENLGPHGKRLYQETLSAVDTESWASVIILSATLIDVLANEYNGPIKSVDGIILNKAFSNKNILWLRNKRNSIIHYEGPVEGMMGGAVQTEILALDAKRSFEILINTVQILFKNF